MFVYYSDYCRWMKKENPETFPVSEQQFHQIFDFVMSQENTEVIIESKYH